MRKDPTEFRKRFAAWKDGKKPYEAGLPVYKKGKTPHEEFVEQMGPVLYKELLRTNTPNIDTAYDHMLRQLAYESDYGRSRVARQQHNYGGYGWNGKTYTTFKDDEDFVRHYVLLMNDRYGAAVNADSVQAYGKALKDKGYYEDTLANYTRNLVGMKSLSRSAAAHKLSNPNLYQIKPLALTPVAEQLESTPQFQPVNIVAPEINTDYSLLNASIQSPTPQSINVWKGKGSPAYGGYSLRMPSIQEYMLTGNIMPRGFKDGKLPGYYLGRNGIEEEKTDATTVNRPMIVLPIKRDFIAEAQRKHAAEAVGPDTRSSYQRKQSLAVKLYANQQYLKAKDDAKRTEGMELMMKTISPSTYIEAAIGQDLGTIGRLATDVAVFGLPGLAKRGIKSIGNLAKIGKLNGHDYHVSAELTNEPINIPFEKYKKEAIQGSLELLFGKNVADKVNRFYQKDVYPRFIDQTYRDFATDEVRDLLGYNGLPKGIKLYGYHDPNSIAFGFSNDGNIYMNYAKLGDELRLFESIIHESEHAQRQLINNSTLFLKPWYKSGYIHVPQNATDEQKIFAKSFPFRGYIDSELQRLLGNYPLPLLVKGVDINPLKEAGASNRELRAAISEDYGGRLGVDLDAIIDNMGNKELERYINGLNGYTDWIYNNRSINFDGIKNTLKKVPAIAAPITILNKYAE